MLKVTGSLRSSGSRSVTLPQKWSCTTRPADTKDLLTLHEAQPSTHFSHKRLPGKCQNNGNSNTRRCLIAGGMGMMLLRFVLLSALALPLKANSQGQVPACCGLESEKLS